MVYIIIIIIIIIDSDWPTLVTKMESEGEYMHTFAISETWNIPIWHFADDDPP